jgi:hypothetical protein
MVVKHFYEAAQNMGSSGSSRLALWERNSGQNAYMCFTKGCINRPTVGGHVQKISLSDRTLYVVPLCGHCNKEGGQELDIWDEATLVPAKTLRIAGVVHAESQMRRPRLASSFD